ncbi:MAG: nucleotidyltransferase [Syntrophobacterales bacterium CG03_land_8_20_14_0_80_58_14]|nr:MAG: nucleotidyltransferase [Syntrophaceae bacterium CG2_30_58_14]PIV01459.1 MAG: nucleotidyltransferase [Syntrophobacterales bacterium CG03_land_8_20_14_0_80_58_14]
MPLDLNSLRKGILSLEKALEVAAAEKISVYDKATQEVIKAGVIQNFEFTYELCWKFMKRWLGNNLGSTYVDGITRRELFRLGAENRLITDVNGWMEYHEARNETAHTYDSEKADEIFRIARSFYADAKRLLEALETRND